MRMVNENYPSITWNHYLNYIMFLRIIFWVYKKGDISNKTENFNVYIGTVVNENGRTTSDLMREMEYYRKSKLAAVGGA